MNMANEIEAIPFPILFVILVLAAIIMIVVAFLMILGSLWVILWFASLIGLTDHPSKSIGRHLTKVKWWISDYWWIISIVLLVYIIIVGLVIVFPDEIFGFFEDLQES